MTQSDAELDKELFDGFEVYEHIMQTADLDERVRGAMRCAYMGGLYRGLGFATHQDRAHVRALMLRMSALLKAEESRVLHQGAAGHA